MALLCTQHLVRDGSYCDLDQPVSAALLGRAKEKAKAARSEVRVYVRVRACVRVRVRVEAMI